MNIKRALISLSDKTDALRLAEKLSNADIEIISTGGTYKLLKEKLPSVKSIEELTNFREMLGGRVKTLHPFVFAGLLADKNNPQHTQELESLGLNTIDLIAVNLYPFEDTISKENVSESEAIEQIDIGGVSLIRAAAKNYQSVVVLTSPKQYDEFIYNFENNNFSDSYKRKLAAEAFRNIANYDEAIADYFGGREVLRYGENPHQKGWLVKKGFDDIFKVLHGKELSYNNLLDIDSAYELIKEFKNERFAAAAIIKHGNPCGAAFGETCKDAYVKAFETDTKSPFGGIIIFSRPLELDAAEEADKIFSEIILAPAYSTAALELLKKKKNRRIIEFKYDDTFEIRKRGIAGGELIQGEDVNTDAKLQWVTRLKYEEKMDDIRFAEKIAKHVKSNAVVFVKDGRTLAIGGGQPSRIDSTKIAVMKAAEYGHNLSSSVCASDAFFPFADGLIEIAEAGADCIVQPGGSVRDNEVIAEADNRNIAMAFTSVRHFRH